MADVAGPISTLPGAMHDMPPGTMCDDHPDVPAYRRVQGETDSFGSEMHDLCKACVDQLNEDRKNADTSGHCDYCKQHKPKLRNRRDSDEGMCGPVYQVCDDCTKSANERIQQEIEDDDRYYGRDDSFDDYD